MLCAGRSSRQLELRAICSGTKSADFFYNFCHFINSVYDGQFRTHWPILHKIPHAQNLRIRTFLAKRTTIRHKVVNNRYNIQQNVFQRRVYGHWGMSPLEGHIQGRGRGTCLFPSPKCALKWGHLVLKLKLTQYITNINNAYPLRDKRGHTVTPCAPPPHPRPTTPLSLVQAVYYTPSLILGWNVVQHMFSLYIGFQVLSCFSSVSSHMQKAEDTTCGGEQFF